MNNIAQKRNYACKLNVKSASKQIKYNVYFKEKSATIGDLQR